MWTVFLLDQMELQEKAMKRLQWLRQKAQRTRNKSRKEPNYNVGDYVLVSKERWPQKKLRKSESQWYGPFLITEVRHNALKVATSPNLGGDPCDISTSQALEDGN